MTSITETRDDEPDDALAAIDHQLTNDELATLVRRRINRCANAQARATLTVALNRSIYDWVKFNVKDSDGAFDQMDTPERDCLADVGNAAEAYWEWASLLLRPTAD